MRIIAQMIARNEGDRFLDEVLAHLKPQVDLIVFTDDASTDSTPQIAEKHGAIVYRNETSMFSVHEGQLRTNAWNNLCEHASNKDWILAIDADEKLYTMNHMPPLKQLLNQKLYDVIGITFYHMWNPTQYRIDKAWAPHSSSRLFKFYPNGKFADRKMACGSEPSYVQQMIRRRRFLKNSGLIMQHLGYVRDEDKRAKYERYMALDGGDFHSKRHIESIIDPEPTLQDWML